MSTQIYIYISPHIYIYIYDIRHFKICMAHSPVQFSTTRETKMVQKKHYVCWASATCHHMVFTMAFLCCPAFFFFFKGFSYLFIYLFIYFWLCWVFVSVQGLSLVAASGGHSSSQCAGLSPLRPLLLRSTGSRRSGSVVVAHGPSCSAACGIFPDQGLNPCSLHWQADS